MSAVVAHLWTSTLVLLVAVLASRFLPLTARTRHAVLLCGLLKFAIPAAAVSSLFRAIGIDLTNLGRHSAASVSLRLLDGTMPLGSLMPAPVSRWPMALGIGWIVPALALAVTWAIARRRLVSSALRAGSPASDREQAAFAAALAQLRLRRSVNVMRSAMSETPAVMRILRPVIVLPDGGCDSLDDAELQSLLRHECAHVARSDNFLAVVQSAIVAAFWFHPLIWFAQRAIATAREQACDETAAATADALDTYISALSKISRIALAPRLAGVSCMAGAHMQERMDYLMRFESLRRRALSHRLVVILAGFIVAAVSLGGGLAAATPQSSSQDRYRLEFSVQPDTQPGFLLLNGRIVDLATKQIVANPQIKFPRGMNTSMRWGKKEIGGEDDLYVEFRDLGSSVAGLMKVSRNGELVQESRYEASVLSEPANRRYTGAPISLDLKDADIKDLLRVFAQLTDTKIDYPQTLQRKVTIKVHDVPWDQVFDEILREQHLSWEMQGNTIVVRENQ